MMEAVLVVCGEKGYRNVTVQDVIDRYGGHRSQFYAHFASKARCYAAAYEFEAERRYAEIQDAARAAESWKERLTVVLEGVGRWASRQPMLARGLVVEVHVAGGSALAKRSELMDRLSRVIDGVRRATDTPHSPPPVTAAFMIGVIESSLTRALMRERPREFTAAAPELVGMVAGAFGLEEPVARI
jgi:AcrR family transcriptional regulator